MSAVESDLPEALLRASSIRSESNERSDLVTTSPSSEGDPIDVSGFEERLGPESVAILPDLVDLFIQEVEPKLVDLRQAVDEGDTAEIRAITHRLSGSSSNISAIQFAESCQRL